MEEKKGDIGMMIDSKVGRDCSSTTIGPTGVQYLNGSSPTMMRTSRKGKS
jgi:hypothetical protein